MNKEQLLAALESEIHEIKVDAVDAVLRFRVLTGRARDAFHAVMSKGDGALSHFESAIVAATVVDDEGNSMFSADEVDALRDKNAAAVAEVAKAAMSVNKIGAAAEAEAAKN
jgi:hypothetical protein